MVRLLLVLVLYLCPRTGENLVFVSLDGRDLARSLDCSHAHVIPFPIPSMPYHEVFNFLSLTLTSTWVGREEAVQPQLVSVPYRRNEGFSPVDSWGTFLYAHPVRPHNTGEVSVPLVTTARFLRAVFSVRWNRPSQAGWYEVVLSFLTPVIRCERRLVPLSESRLKVGSQARLW